MNNLGMMIVILGGTFGFMIVMRRRLSRQFAHLRAGELATRLGMKVVTGDPEHNLATMSVQPAVQNVSSAKGMLTQLAAGQVGGTLGEFQLRLAGEPYGVPAELVLFCRQDYSPGLTTNTTTTWHDLRLSVHTRAAVAPFDLRLRQEMAGLETRAREGQRMPAQGFGDATLDQRYAIESYDADLPRRVAAAIAGLPPHLLYAHVIGSGNQVSFVMTPASVNASAPSLEQILHALVQVAAALEGARVAA